MPTTETVPAETESVTVIVRDGESSKSLTVYGAALERVFDEIVEDQLNTKRRPLAINRKVVLPRSAATPTPA